jgi:hypothetical protein
VKLEAAQALLCLEGYAAVVGIDLEEATRVEWERVMSISKDEWQKRHDRKVAAGIATKREP